MRKTITILTPTLLAAACLALSFIGLGCGSSTSRTASAPKAEGGMSVEIRYCNA